jgi:hypothetical protein
MQRISGGRGGGRERERERERERGGGERLDVESNGVIK